MTYDAEKISCYRAMINGLEGLKDEFDYIGVSDSVSARLQELIDACREDIRELES